MAAIRCGGFFADPEVPSTTLSRIVSVLDLLYHCSPLHTLVLKAEHLSPDTQGSEQERAVFSELRRVFVEMNNSGPTDRIALQPFLERLSAYASSDYLHQPQSLQSAWDDIVSVVLAVNPPLWEIFLGSGSGLGVNLNVGSSGAYKTTFLHCFRTVFGEGATLEEMLRRARSAQPQSMQEKVNYTNSMTLLRAPLLLVVSTEGTGDTGASLRFSESVSVGEDEVWYDLVGAAVSEAGPGRDRLQYVFRPEGSAEGRWLKGVPGCSSFDAVKASDDFLLAEDRPQFSSLHIFARRDSSQSFRRILLSLNRPADGEAVSDARDVPSSGAVVQGENGERNRKASTLQGQGDLALTHRKFREASEHYSKALQAAIVGSDIYLRVRDKLECVTQLLTLEAALLFSEKGEEAMRQSNYAAAKELFSQALRLNPELLHLQYIVAGIDKTVQVQGAAQKMAEAQQAMKTLRFKLANQLLREAVALNPDKLPSVQPLLDNLVPLMKSEEAIVRHRAGLTAMEDKRYEEALLLFSEAIVLLPEPSSEMATFLTDRAMAQFELKDFTSAASSCEDALALQSDLALAHFRLGMAQFALDRFDEAGSSYERALKCDSSLADSVKVKMRQLFTAREVQQRKEREAERVRQAEAQKKMLEEKRQREEALKREKAERLAAEKAERQRLRDERIQREAKERDLLRDANKDKDAEKERIRQEKAEKEAQRASERERAKAEKERERERIRAEKERAKQEELEREREAEAKKREFALELEKAEQRRKEQERERELEKERALQELERTIAERERLRQDKKKEENLKPRKERQAAEPLKDSYSSRQSQELSAMPPVVEASLQLGASVASSSSSILSLKDCCIDCKKEIDGISTFYVFGECNHRVSCETCAVRNRAMKKVLNCRLCSRVLPVMVCSNTQLLYEVLSLRIIDNPSSDYSLDPAAQVYFKKEFFSKNIRTLWQHRCQICSSDLGSASELKKHLWHTHNRRQCNLCEQNEFMFPSEQALFTLEEYDSHVSLHPKCSVCGSAFFDDKALSNHKTASHPMCRQCFNDKGISTYFADTAALSLHMSSSHFVCSLCPDNVSYHSDDGLRAHIAQVHESTQWGPTVRKGFGAAATLDLLRRPSPLLSESFSGHFQESSGTDLKARFLTYQSAELEAASDILSPGLSDSSSSSSFTQAFQGLDPSRNSFASLSAGLGANLQRTQPAIQPKVPDPVTSAEPFRNIGLFSGNDPVTPLDFGQSYDPGLDVGFNRAMNLDTSSSLFNTFERNLSPAPGTPRFGSAFSGASLGYDAPRRNSSDGNKPSSIAPKIVGSSATFSSSFLGGGMVPEGEPQKVSAGGYGSSLNYSGGVSSGFSSLGLDSSVSSNLSSGYTGSSSLANSVPKLTTNDLPDFSTDPKMLSAIGLPLSKPQSSVPLPPQITGTLAGHAQSTNLFSPAISPHMNLPNPPLIAPEHLGIDGDVLPESVFPTVAWLRQFDMCMYRWAGDSAEWTEYALHLPSKTVIDILVGENGAQLLELQRSSGCKMWMAREILRGREANFLVFLRGSSGQPSNACMNIALDLISTRLRPLLYGPSSRLITGNQLVDVTSPIWRTPSSELFDIDGLDLGAFNRSKGMTSDEQRGLPLQGGFVLRAVEIPREAVGIVIGQGGKKIKELCQQSGAKIQFRVNRSAERDGRPGLLELVGLPEHVETGLQLVWDMLQNLGKEFVEVNVSKMK